MIDSSIQNAATAHLHTARVQSSGGVAKRRGTILVVEDDADIREMFRITLKAEGFHVLAVGDGMDALRVLETAQPTLIVLDLGLPRLSGRDVAREVSSRADLRHVPIVVVTGTDTSDFYAWVSCILHKPVDPDALVQIVKRCLAKESR